MTPRQPRDDGTVRRRSASLRAGCSRAAVRYPGNSTWPGRGSPNRAARARPERRHRPRVVRGRTAASARTGFGPHRFSRPRGPRRSRSPDPPEPVPGISRACTLLALRVGARIDRVGFLVIHPDMILQGEPPRVARACDKPDGPDRRRLCRALSSRRPQPGSQPPLSTRSQRAEPSIGWKSPESSTRPRAEPLSQLTHVAHASQLNRT